MGNSRIISVAVISVIVSVVGSTFYWFSNQRVETKEKVEVLFREDPVSVEKFDSTPIKATNEIIKCEEKEQVTNIEQKEASSPLTTNERPRTSEERQTPHTVSPETDSTVVYITRTGTKYHRLTCQYVKKTGSASTVKQAQLKGFTPCSKCNP